MLWSKPDFVGWSLVELFSGEGNLSTAWKESGYRVASYDLLQSEKTMNFLSNGGYASIS